MKLNLEAFASWLWYQYVGFLQWFFKQIVLVFDDNSKYDSSVVGTATTTVDNTYDFSRYNQ